MDGIDNSLVLLFGMYGIDQIKLNLNADDNWSSHFTSLSLNLQITKMELLMPILRRAVKMKPDRRNDVDHST